MLWNGVLYRLKTSDEIVDPLRVFVSDKEHVKQYVLVQQDFDRHAHHTRKFFETDWNEQDSSIIYTRSDAVAPRPRTLPTMLEIARKLSAPFSFIRIDLYTDDRQVLVGEITNCSENAGGVFQPPSAERSASELLFG